MDRPSALRQHLHTPVRNELWLGAILTIYSLLRINLAGIPLERDEGEYAYLAWRWNMGEVPYLHGFNQKFPFAFLFYSWIMQFFGNNAMAIHWAVHAYSCLTLFVIFLIGKELFTPLIGLLAAGLSGLMFLDLTVLGQSANTEMFLILPLMFGFYSLLRCLKSDRSLWAFVAGISLALAGLFKQHALLFIGAAVLTLLQRSHRARRIFFLGAGFCLPLSLTFLYFHQHGALNAFWDSTVLYNSQYVQRFSFQHYWWNFWRLMRPHFQIFWLVHVAVLQGILTTFYDTWKGLKHETAGRLWLLIGWLLFSCGIISIGGFFRPHYLVLALPFLSLLAAHQALQLSWKELAHAPSLAICAVGILVLQLGFMLLSNPWYYTPGSVNEKSERLYQTNYFYTAPLIGDLVSRHTLPEERVFIFGNEPETLFYARRLSATRYIFLYPLMIPSLSCDSRQQELFQEINHTMPAVVVTYYQGLQEETLGCPSYLFTAMRTFLTTHHYKVIGLLKKTGTGTSSVLEGPEADVQWRRSPSWPEDWLSTYKVVVWKRPPEESGLPAR